MRDYGKRSTLDADSQVTSALKSVMSDNWLTLIPKSPEFVPTKDAQAQALALFRRIAPKADDIEIEVSDRPRFIDCGANLEKINCPHCQRVMETGWWRDWMSAEAELGFPLKAAGLPCCGAVTSLADLLYNWPQGFARFSLAAKNPSIKDLTEADTREFETLMGCPVRRIWRHI